MRISLSLHDTSHGADQARGGQAPGAPTTPTPAVPPPPKCVFGQVLLARSASGRLSSTAPPMSTTPCEWPACQVRPNLTRADFGYEERTRTTKKSTAQVRKRGRVERERERERMASHGQDTLAVTCPNQHPIPNSFIITYLITYPITSQITYPNHLRLVTSASSPLTGPPPPPSSHFPAEGQHQAGR